MQCVPVAAQAGLSTVTTLPCSSASASGKCEVPQLTARCYPSGDMEFLNTTASSLLMLWFKPCSSVVQNGGTTKPLQAKSQPCGMFALFFATNYSWLFLRQARLEIEEIEKNGLPDGVGLLIFLDQRRRI
jgi:hypothetical protein